MALRVRPVRLDRQTRLTCAEFDVPPDGSLIDVNGRLQGDCLRPFNKTLNKSINSSYFAIFW